VIAGRGVFAEFAAVPALAKNSPSAKNHLLQSNYPFELYL
jgi:hypothetical protein